MALSPATFYDDNGVVRLQGQLDSSGGSQPVTRATYTGNNVAVPNSGNPTHLTWNTLLYGTELLDRTDPAIPTMLTAGVYALTAFTSPQDEMADGKAFRISLFVSGAEPVAISQTVAVEDSFDFDSFCIVPVTYYVEAGATVEVYAQQADAGPIDFVLGAYLQRLA